MIRQDRKGDVTENVVVELKRPTVALGETQLSQVKKYLQVIRKEDRFNMGNVKWTFYLVGNKFNTSGFLNVIGVTEFLQKKIAEAGGDPSRETLTLIPTKKSKLFYVDSQGGYWRAYQFLTDATCYEQVQ